ncbi:MAG: glycosyltransferase, partial [Bacilli bacterium]|nr:glycosyltransferase [Bacilli bacterium]
GNGNELDNVLKIVKDKGLDNVVEYHGALPLNELENYLVSADALLVPLKNEGYVGKTIPNKAIQYLKYGRPIIGVISNSARELLKEAGGSILVEEDVESISKAYDEIIKLSNDEKQRLGDNNRKYFEDNLCVKSIVKKIENVLKEAK